MSVTKTDRKDFELIRQSPLKKSSLTKIQKKGLFQQIFGAIKGTCLQFLKN